jgi:hypothetical protein
VTTLATFRSVRAVGTVLPAEALARAVDLGMPGQRTEDYQLTPGMTINGAARPAPGRPLSAPTAPGKPPWSASPTATRR